MNYTAIIVAAVVTFIIGMLWYSPMLFGKMYMKAVGHHGDNNKNNMVFMMVLEFIFNLVTVWALYWIFMKAGVTEMNDALMTAGVLWLGFSLITTWSNNMWANGNNTVMWISSICRLICALAAGALLISL